jgi:hypothetical protein
MPEVKKIFASRPIVTKPRQYLLDKIGDSLSLLGKKRPRAEKFSIGGQGEASQSYGQQAKALNNLNCLGVWSLSARTRICGNR